MDTGLSYRYRTPRYVRCHTNTVTPGAGMDLCTGVGTDIGTTSLPVPDTSASSAEHLPDTRHRCDINPVPPHCYIKIGLILILCDPVRS